MAEQNISGGRELDAFLQTLTVKLEKNIMRSALRAGANEFKEAIKANVPVKSGATKRSVRVTTGTKRNVVFAYVKVGGKKAPHAIFSEFGTKPHKIAPKGAGGLLIGGQIVDSADHPGARAKPFARPAFDSKGQAAIAAVGAQIRKRLTVEGINTPAPEGA